MKKVGIIATDFNNVKVKKIVGKILYFLENKRLSVSIPYRSGNVDLLIALGGDGIILKAIRMIKNYETPILGVNLGKVGFLAFATAKNIIPLLKKIITTAEAYNSLEANLLEVEIYRKGEKIFSGHGLNDIVLRVDGSARVISLQVSCKNFPLMKFSGDGLIVSSAIGSTAYNLSAGGPIIYPQEKILIISPIAPHTLNLRHVVLPHTIPIKLKILPEKTNCRLSIDGQLDKMLSPGDIVKINLSEKKIKLVGFDMKSYFRKIKTTFFK
jgi:NAD+ kinase